MRTTGAEIVKLAVATRTLSDLVPLLETRRADTLLIGMGAAGVVSRILAGRFGSPWTYAGPGVAPGQLSASRLLQEFRFRRIRSDAAIYGLVGRPIGHSLSAAMHNAGFEASGINAAYVPFEASDIADFRRCADALDVRGASITTPFKLDVLSILDEVSPLATAVGAVNTIVRRDGRWIGMNTDVEGFLEPLKRRMDLRDARATDSRRGWRGTRGCIRPAAGRCRRSPFPPGGPRPRRRPPTRWVRVRSRCRHAPHHGICW